MTQPKYNPFKPNSIVNPGMFVGRMDELKRIERNLFQTANENPQHFLIQGERGIGKSSLLFYVEHVAKGTIQPLVGDSHSFLCLSVDLNGSNTQVDIARKVGRSLKEALGRSEKLKKSAKAVWDWVTNWEVLGVKYNKDQSTLDPEEVCETLVTALADVCASSTLDISGIIILIDEADRPPVDADLGQFLKTLTERLTRSGCNKVIVGLAGLPSTLAKLRESHESSPRLFHTILLDPLSVDERKQVIRLSLDEANRKNTQKTDISDEGLDFLVDLSEGYPHFIQQFGYSAFEADSDDLIDGDDVVAGAYDEGGAIAQLGDKFFNEMYHARIASEDYRRVLDAMAEHGDAWVSRQELLKKAKVSESVLNNALAALKTKQIINQDDTRRGFYRLPTKSFAAWINAIRAVKANTDVG